MSLDSEKLSNAWWYIQVLQILIIKRILEFYHWLKMQSTIAFDVICSLHFFWIKHLPNSYSWKAILSKLFFEQKQCSMKKCLVHSAGHAILWLPNEKRLWCWERLRASGEGEYRGWDGWMASLTQWTWVWTNTGR